jgi:hypothetical protein
MRLKFVSKKMPGKTKVCKVVSLIVLLLISSFPYNSISQEHELSRSVCINKEIEFFVLELPDSVGGGFEPHILAGPSIDGEEWLYIDSPRGFGSQLSGNLWISKDGGYSWEFKQTGRGSINQGWSGDSYCEVFSDGTIVFTDLYPATVSVATSFDGGETWFHNPQASVTPYDDRQWLAIGPTVDGGPFSDSETLYLAYNQFPIGHAFSQEPRMIIQYSRNTATGYGWVRGNGGLPVAIETGPRDCIAVDKNDGTLYLPNKEGEDIVVYVSNDGANSFTRHVVLQEPRDTHNIFKVVKVDSDGNVYLTWSAEKEHIFMAISRDKGQSWEISQVTKTPGSRVFPWIAAGDAGRIGLTWYETDIEGASDDSEAMENATWDVKAALSVNALSENRTFYFTTILENIHTGNIHPGGLDRDLGDFFTCDVDGLGRLVVAFGMDGDDGPRNYQATVVFAKQMEGPFLLENVGPIANFTYKTEDLTVTVDASGSKDLSGNGIDQYLWNWGDGTNSTDETSTHEYNSHGTYEITLKVINMDAQSDKITMTVDVSQQEEEFNTTPMIMLAMILAVAVLAYYLYKKQTKHSETKSAER